VRLSANFCEFKIRSSVWSGELAKVHPFFMGHPVLTFSIYYLFPPYKQRKQRKLKIFGMKGKNDKL